MWKKVYRMKLLRRLLSVTSIIFSICFSSLAFGAFTKRRYLSIMQGYPLGWQSVNGFDLGAQDIQQFSRSFRLFTLQYS